ncbi:hypothetical protein AMJ82_03705 [candidate division TA06 bacterium SM23_40]|uniref:Selenoprotein n=1 Tax=candidate division TA06 bacterium SM23_40 TaxID=1703774 RepID=A0A0S8GAK9_UNCT6|nr:MAG: hypothetical protein AMJ82_03705 [candidate division TA06 bacterium SM23_40]
MWLAADVGLWREQMTGAAAGVQRRRRRVLCGAALVPAGPREIGRGAIPAARAVRGEDGAALEEMLGLKAELIEGDDGIFDVAVDGDVVFSKQERGEFISTSEIVELVRVRAQALET